jgi:hypothetical protein
MLESIRSFVLVLALMLLLVCTSLAKAQNGSIAKTAITGRVFDSIQQRPLKGAVVQVVRVGPDSSDRAGSGVLAAVADSNGFFRIDNVRLGRYAIGFQHPALGVLGLESPISGLEITNDSSVSVDLAIPSASSLRTRLCETRTTGVSAGAIVGLVTIAPGSQPAANADVLAQWGELSIQGRTMTTVQQRARTTSGDDGSYRLCGVPVEGTVAFTVTLPKTRTVAVDLEMPAGGVLRQDVALVGTGTSRGNSTIALRVLDTSGTEVVSGDATISALGRSEKIEHGHVTFAAVPEGSWILSFHALGYEPRNVLLEADADAARTPPVPVSLRRVAQVLDPVNVVAKGSSMDQRTLADIDERMRLGAGTLIRDDALRNVTEASDAIRLARGFVVKGPTNVEARPFRTGACRSAVSNMTMKSSSTAREVAVYLDGNRMPGGLETINNMLRPSDILAVETYADVLSAPFIWRKNDTCAVVAFWTKH